ncbi:MAG: gamma carbonic anhydrase family protein [Bdellovibrionales bacterium]|jgi:carbonic anhydrase/acetyltransferase-like protein (isoleucine patch superfamily)|nr:gamma carbonic anhydrase family protein [Bdellovibrionales bacterium]
MKANILPLLGFIPRLGEGTFVAPGASIIGDVNIGQNCSVWFSTVIRGDVGPIEIGDETNIQDGSIIHGTFHKAFAKIGSRVTVGHLCMLHGCEIGDLCLIGMGTTIMDGAKIPSRSIVGAGSLVTENASFPEEGWLILGRPAKAVRKLKPEELAFLEKSADNYLMYKDWYQNPSQHKARP